MHNDMRLFIIHVPGAIPSTPRGVWHGTIDYASNPELVDVLNAGYTVLNHQIVPYTDGTDGSGGVLLSLFLVRPVEVPDDPSGIESA